MIRVLFHRHLLISHNICYTPSRTITRRLYSSNKSTLNDDGNLLDLTRFPPERIRNFCIIAHIDHGKSTLADRLMELTGTIKKGNNKQVLDKLQVEQERGITVKAQTVSLIHRHSKDNQLYLLNLIDTPGHVDFHYEVSRSMAACQGALLVVDATQGIQAQTIANYTLAVDQGLSIVPVLNKIDLGHADVEAVKLEMAESLGVDCLESGGGGGGDDGCLLVSAKSGLNVDQLLPAIIERIPPPPPPLVCNGQGDGRADLGNVNPRILLFDSWFDNYRGVIALISMKEGRLRKGDVLVSCHNGAKHAVVQVGLLHPEKLMPSRTLEFGQVGYMITSSMKQPKDAIIGDTFYLDGQPSQQPLPGFRKPQSMVFAGIFPLSNSEFLNLNDAIDRLTLNDSSVQVMRTNSNSLGLGFRCGFLGMLHLDVFRQRIEHEFGLNVIITNPSVFYKVHMKSGETSIVENPAEYPENLFQIKFIEEPVIPAKIITPEKYLGNIMTLCDKRRGHQNNMEYVGNRVILDYEFPLAEIVENHFFNELKHLSSGFASLGMAMDEMRFQESDIVKMDVLLNGNIVDALATLTHRTVALEKSRELAQRLHKLLDRQLFEVNIQVAVNGKPVAREVLKALRKNVTAKCYGGDQTRKRKLLDKQKEGKKKMKTIGKIEISPETFLSLVQQQQSTS